MNDMETLARRRVELVAQIESIKEEIAKIDTQILDAIEVGGHIDIGGEPVWRVQQQRSFNLDKALTLVPDEVKTAATVTQIDKKLLQSLMPPLLRDACLQPGKIFVTKAGR